MEFAREQITVTGDITLKLQYKDGETLKPSALNSGGPHVIGRQNILIIVAENGDDADYNDTVVQFMWVSKPWEHSLCMR